MRCRASDGALIPQRPDGFHATGRLLGQRGGQAWIPAQPAIPAGLSVQREAKGHGEVSAAPTLLLPSGVNNIWGPNCLISETKLRSWNWARSGRDDSHRIPPFLAGNSHPGRRQWIVLRLMEASAARATWGARPRAIGPHQR